MVISSSRIKKLPAIILAGSLSCLALLTILTNPLRDIFAIFIFFILLAVALISLGYLILGVDRSTPSKVKSRIIIVGIFIDIAIMFSSSQTLGLTDLLVLILSGYGLIFYINRRNR